MPGSSLVYMHLAGLLLAPEEREKKGQSRERGSSPPAMCSVSEGSSTDPLVARFRQVEETLEKLHRENRSLKSKVPRYNALCTLYHESVQQLKHLQLQLAAKDATIRELRSGLARQQPTEPGAEPARSLVDSLLEQLGQARQQLRDSERLSAQKMETLSQVKRGEPTPEGAPGPGGDPSDPAPVPRLRRRDPEAGSGAPSAPPPLSASLRLKTGWIFIILNILNIFFNAAARQEHRVALEISTELLLPAAGERSKKK